MKIMSQNRIVRQILALLMVSLAVGCTHDASHDFFEHESLTEKLEKQQVVPPSPFAESGYEQTALVTYADSLHGTFLVPTRVSSITKFPCSTCHDRSLAQMKAGVPENARKAHWDIEIQHAGASVMTCTTCHNSSDLNALHSLTGQPISFDESFRVCAQCHATQFSDWQGGAHGKRLSGWGAERVAQTCVGCHNPHRPQWEKRWPAILERTQK
jgi:hypothetical protein